VGLDLAVQAFKSGRAKLLDANGQFVYAPEGAAVPRAANTRADLATV